MRRRDADADVICSLLSDRQREERQTTDMHAVTAE
ncbi:hypothetical protein PVAP13_2NG334400 [Panicum virgatum]|uniref:Uncharacterized protein n=1 Tax=Panicum virgatum TaxID=38727 RepID=A0A8T0VKV3_PANVG|nr:hypothetical protein PVAP13_2NG334400 [Panicum virgatum]